MSDIFKEGLDFGADFNAETYSVENSKTESTNVPSSNETEQILSNYESLYANNNYSALTEAIIKDVENHSDDSTILNAISSWLMDDRKVLKYESLVKALQSCLASLNNNLRVSGDITITSELRAKLRSIKRELNQRRATLLIQQSGLEQEIKDNQSDIADNQKQINSASSSIEVARNNKERAEQKKNSIPKSRSFSAKDSASAGAMLGGIIIWLLVTLEGCAKGGFDQIAGFFLGIFGGVIMGAPIGAIVGLIIGAIVAGVRESSNEESIRNTNMTIDDADKALRETNSAKAELEREQQQLNIRQSTIQDRLISVRSTLENNQRHLDNIDELLNTLG